jgi:integrase
MVCNHCATGRRWIWRRNKSERSRRTVPLSPPVVSLLKAQRAGTSGRTAAWFSPRSWAAQSIRGTFYGRSRSPRARQVWRASAYTLSGTRRPWRGLSRGRTSEAVADPLGHSSTSVTGDVYGHTSDATTRAAIDGLTSALRSTHGTACPRQGNKAHRRWISYASFSGRATRTPASVSVSPTRSWLQLRSGSRPS